ncbi:hypothetical protein VTK73DRAFT_5439 [Phialemonium thermophilum]|uniref:Uncharacterized protein n=1 Tax=Phialemonium thermophilum TaxID=223376 RepID=A0ABR3V1X8_9PEZI
MTTMSSRGSSSAAGARGQVQHADGRLGGQADDALAEALEEAQGALLLGALQRLAGQAADARGHGGEERVGAGGDAEQRVLGPVAGAGDAAAVLELAVHGGGGQALGQRAGELGEGVGEAVDRLLDEGDAAAGQGQAEVLGLVGHDQALWLETRWTRTGTETRTFSSRRALRRTGASLTLPMAMVSTLRKNRSGLREEVWASAALTRSVRTKERSSCMGWMLSSSK